MPDNETHRNQGRKKHGKSSSAIRASRANPKAEYVDYVLRMTFNPAMTGRVITHEDSSKYPVVVSDAYIPGTALATANVTIKGVVYTFPKDFDFDYTVHGESNEVTGFVFELFKETLYFKNLPGHPTLTGRAEEKGSGLIFSPSVDFSHAEMFGNFQLTGTGMFKNVKGSGIGMFGVSTGFVVYHLALIKGWPL
jgi:hypothetical protein